MHELSGLTVHEPTAVGWDERSLPNETVDEQGILFPHERGFGVPDGRAPSVRRYDHPEVEALRAQLKLHNGIRGLEICEPHEIDRIARIFHRDGFCVVRDLLDPDLLDRFREGCTRVLRDILSIEGSDGRKYMTESGRLPHRYSYGTSSASRQMLHDPVWASMIDLPTTTPILKTLFGADDYAVIGSGGDLCLPGAIEYQHLHADFREKIEFGDRRLEQAEILGVQLRRDEETGELTERTKRMIVEVTSPLITINFAMSDLTWENGPIRQIPGTHGLSQSPPRVDDEPDWMRYSTCVGAPAGAGIFRDNRAWHGATPNLSREVRALPNVEYVAPWFPAQAFKQTMPHEIWETLSPHAQMLCRHVKAPAGVWPKGAGVMHPLAQARRDAAA
jgi:hypothetical protein